MTKRQHLIAVCSVVSVVVFIVLVIVVSTGDKNISGKSNRAERASYTTNEPLTETAVFLYFADRKRPYLISEERRITHPETPALFARQILSELIKGSNTGLMRTIPADSKIRAFYITRDKTAYVDFFRSVMDNHPGGAGMENLSVYSIVNSLALNIPEIEKVKILIDGQEAETLAGHIALSSPLFADMLLVR